MNVSKERRTTAARWERLIEVYSKTTDEFITEHNIDSVPLEHIKRVFGVNPDDPECLHIHRIDPEHARALQGLVDMTFDFDRYEYVYIVCSS